MTVFKQADDYFMGYSCFLSIHILMDLSYLYHIISAFTSDRGCPASITYLMAFIKVRTVSEVFLFLSHYFAFQQE